MTSSSSFIPTHILLSTQPFPSSSPPSSSSSTLSSPSSISYHFTSDGPFDPLPHLSASSSQRVLVWDTRTEEVTSLSSEVMVGEGGARKEGGANEKEGEEGSAIWVVDLQEGPRLGEGQEEDTGASIEELLEVLKKQEDLLAKFDSKKEEAQEDQGGDGEERS